MVAWAAVVQGVPMGRGESDVLWSIIVGQLSLPPARDAKLGRSRYLKHAVKELAQCIW